MIKLITRLTSTAKAEAVTTATHLLDTMNAAYIFGDAAAPQWSLSSDLRTLVDASDANATYPIHYYRNGAEVVAVADFYIGEAGVSCTGSQGGCYELTDETLVEA